MSFSNRVFNINGTLKDTDSLKKALELVFRQKGENTKTIGWKETIDHGLILLWSQVEGADKFLTPLSAENVAPLVLEWLMSSDAAKIRLKDRWDVDADHDGHNGPGWRVYVEDWGRIADMYQAICAIRPVFCWYGK